MRKLWAVVMVLAMVAPGLAAGEAGPRASQAVAWGAEVRLTEEDGDDTLPAMAVDAWGNAHVMWARDGKQYYMKCDSQGRLLVEEKELAAAGAPGQPCGQPTERAGVDGSGAFHAVWLETGDLICRYCRLDSEGNVAVGPMPLGPASTDGHALGMAVAQSGRPYFCYKNGTAFELAWLENDTFQSVKVADNPGTGLTIGLDAWDRPHIFWWDYETGKLAVRGFAADGQTILPTVLLDAAVEGWWTIPMPRLAFTSDGAMHMLQASKASGMRTLYYTRLAPDGKVLNKGTVVTGQAGDCGDICDDGRGNIYFCWGDWYDGELYHAVMRPGTENNTPAAKKLTGAAGKERDPDIGMDPQGGIALAWRSGRNGDDDIYYRHAGLARLELLMSAGDMARMSNILPSETRTAPMTVRNNGTESDTVSMELGADFRGAEGAVGGDYSGDGWSVRLLGYEGAMALEPNETWTMRLSVRGPDTGEAGDYICVTVAAVSAVAPQCRDELRLKVYLSIAGKIEVGCDEREKLASAGGIAVYNISVKNAGNRPEEIRLTAEGPPGWGWILGGDRLSLDHGNATEVALEVRAPLEAMGGDSALVTVTATSIEDGDLTDSVATVTSVAEEFGLRIWPERDETRVSPGEKAVCNLTVERTGNSRRTVLMDVTADDDRWNVSLEVPPMQPEGEGEFTARLTFGAPEGARKSDRVAVFVEAFDEERLAEANCTVFGVGTLYSNMLVRVPTKMAELSPGGKALFEVELINLGNGDDLVRPGEFLAPAGWSVELFARGSDKLSEGVKVPYQGHGWMDVVLGAPMGALAGAYNVSGQVLDSNGNVYGLTLEARVLLVPGLRLEVENERQGAPLGKMVGYGLNLTNAGNGVDEFTFFALGLPEGWTAAFWLVGAELKNELVLAPGENRTVLALVRVPLGTALDGIEFRVEARSGGGGKANVSLGLEVLRPDLRIVRVEFSAGEGRAGKVEAVNLTIENAGGAGAEAVALVLSVRGRPDIWLEIGNFSAGEKRVQKILWVPGSGFNKLRFVIDPGDRVPESNESNNEAVAFRTGIGGSVAGGPDDVLVRVAVGVAVCVALVVAVALWTGRAKRREVEQGAARRKRAPRS